MTYCQDKANGVLGRGWICRVIHVFIWNPP